MFGGMTISLIFPKLIRSVARDGILNFLLGRDIMPHRFHLTTQGKPAVLNGQLAKPATDCPSYPKLSIDPAFRGDEMGRQFRTTEPPPLKLQ
jgi:hypothetical protein